MEFIHYNNRYLRLFQGTPTEAFQGKITEAIDGYTLPLGTSYRTNLYSNFLLCYSPIF